MSITKREIKIILYALGILVALAAWWFFYKPQMEDNKKIEAEVVKLQEDLNFLKGLEIREADLVAEREATQAAQEEILGHFPSGFYEEDVILHANAIEKDYESIFIDVVRLEELENVWSSASQTVPYVLCTRKADYSFDVNYADIKAILAFINADNQYKSLDEVVLNYDLETGDLEGHFWMNHYLVMGTDKQYVTPEIPSVPVGTPNIFGTVSGARIAN